MKKLSVLLVLAIASIGTAGSPVFAAGNKEGSSNEANSGSGRTRLVVQADIVPHAELLEFVKPKLAAQGIDIEINTRTDSSLANEQVDKGELDANFFQHEPYLRSIIAERHFDLANAGNIHVEPIGAYSDKYAGIDQIPPNATIAIPNDATNEYRALRILEKAGFITLKQGTDVYQTTVANTVDQYLKQITLQELDSALILRVRQDFDVYITNTNKVLEAGLDATKALFREGADSPYANIIAVKNSRVNDPAIKALVSALRSEDVRTFIEGKYKGAVIPAF
ncbi:MAG: methionine ABC transporter substrate-binding protein [Treponema sp.]|jgi:D-methionine transport system substrate-binding protein|nr:methionine ABC transporter substrate-binding protein [Treponema sp.]